MSLFTEALTHGRFGAKAFTEHEQVCLLCWAGSRRDGSNFGDVLEPYLQSSQYSRALVTYARSLSCPFSIALRSLVLSLSAMKLRRLRIKLMQTHARKARVGCINSTAWSMFFIAFVSQIASLPSFLLILERGAEQSTKPMSETRKTALRTLAQEAALAIGDSHNRVSVAQTNDHVAANISELRCSLWHDAHRRGQRSIEQCIDVASVSLECDRDSQHSPEYVVDVSMNRFRVDLYDGVVDAIVSLVEFGQSANMVYFDDGSSHLNSELEDVSSNHGMLRAPPVGHSSSQRSIAASEISTPAVTAVHKDCEEEEGVVSSWIVNLRVVIESFRVVFVVPAAGSISVDLLHLAVDLGNYLADDANNENLVGMNEDVPRILFQKLTLFFSFFFVIGSIIYRVFLLCVHERDMFSNVRRVCG